MTYLPTKGPAPGSSLIAPPLHSVSYPSGGDGNGTPGAVNGARSVVLNATAATVAAGSVATVADTIIMKTSAPDNQVALGTQIYAYNGAGAVWAQNPLVMLTPGCNTAGAVAEFDINNFDGDAGAFGGNPAHPYHSFGTWITGSGPYKCTAATFITSAGNSQWYQGIWFGGNCISDNTVYDGTNSTVSYSVHGSHVIGLDTIGATISDSAVRMAYGQKVSWGAPVGGTPASIAGFAGGVVIETGVGGSATITGLGLRIGDPAQGAGVRTLSFETSGNANNYDAQIRVSGGTSSAGQGTVDVQAAALTINQHPVVSAVVLPTSPTGADIPSGSAAVVKNTGDGSVRLWYNDAGVFRSVALT